MKKKLIFAHLSIMRTKMNGWVAAVVGGLIWAGVGAGTQKECPSEGFYSVAGDCTRFYRCVRGAFGRFQGEGLIFGSGALFE